MSTPLQPMDPVALIHLAHVDRHLAQIPGGYTVLDNRPIAEMCGDLRADGFDAHLFVLALNDAKGTVSDTSFEELVRNLKDFPVLVFDKPWTDAQFKRLRARLPDATLIARGVNHRVQNPPVHFTCEDEDRETLPHLLSYLSGKYDRGPRAVMRRLNDAWVVLDEAVMPAQKERAFAPELSPTVINPELLPSDFSYAIVGQHGCPFQENARDNPFYAGVHLPRALGVGCSFCPTALEYKADGATVNAASVLEQLIYIRQSAPEMKLLVLRDQLPFSYLPRAMQACVDAGLKDFTLLLETRADWLLQGARKFDEALQIAHAGGIELAPYLIGIENFSQVELDRLNKGISAETNIDFLDHIWAWKGQYGDTLNLSYTMFGFILFTPWTTLEDLRLNLDGVKRTRLLEFFGGILRTKLMPFPDTTIYYLVAKDGLIKGREEGADKALAGEFDDIVRPGQYLPYADWVFAESNIQKLAELAWEASKYIHVDQELQVLERLIEAFEADSEACLEDILKDLTPPEGSEPGDGPVRIGAHAALAVDERWPEPDDSLKLRAHAILGPSELLWEGWELRDLAGDNETLCLKLAHDIEPSFIAEIGKAGSGPCFREVSDYAIRYRGASLSKGQQSFLETLVEKLS
jgi:hypothetical protein